MFEEYEIFGAYTLCVKHMQHPDKTLATCNMIILTAT
jgi:hypothetical protein